MPRKNEETVRLDKAIDLFFAKLATADLAPATLRTKRRTLEALTEATGRLNRTTRHLTEEDFDKCLTMLVVGCTPEENRKRRLKGKPPRHGRTPASLSQDRTTLEQFVDFLKHRKLIKASFNPLYEVTQSKRDNGTTAPERTFQRRNVPKDEWPDLLDRAAEHHARTRMIVACGIFFGRRAGEIAHIQLKHINKDRTRIELYNLKRGRATHAASGGLPISPWMRAELDAYLAWYEEQYGPLQDDWFLCPSKVQLVEVGGLRDPQTWPMRPEVKANPARIISDAKEALRYHGWTDDMLFREGVHTLRRSAAIATEADEGIAAAQALMDHSSPNTTLIYTGNRAGKAAMERAIANQIAPGSEPEPTEPAPTAPVGIDPTQLEAIVGAAVRAALAAVGVAAPVIPHQADRAADGDLAPVIELSDRRKTG